ncbi:MAG: amidohydrolase [FCB group bacterium]|nr:amidohydrolase [FCB group bacterium]
MLPQRKLFYNARVITLDGKQPRANSLLVSDGILEAVGENLTTEGSGCERIDLQNGVVVPGLTDAHVHLQSLGRFLEGLQLNEVTSAEIIARLVRRKAIELPPGEWILGRGWDQTKWPGQGFPADEVLTRAAPDHPVMLTRVDGHAVWVNKAARDRAGYIGSMNLPEGGVVKQECVFIDNAMDLITRVLPGTTDAVLERQIRLGAKTFASRGLTGVHDVWQDERIIRIIKKLVDAGEFPLRCYGLLEYSSEDLLKEYFARGPYLSDRYTIRGVKAFIDGAFGSRGAALLEPYADDPQNRGLLLMPAEELKQLALRCREAGFQLCTHAIGDRGCRVVLNTYAAVIGKAKNHRWRIEHAEMVAQEDLRQFQELRVIPSLQPSHCTSDMPWIADRIGPDRTRFISPLKTFIDLGLKIPGGSDSPIEKGDPLEEFYAAVTRQDHQGWPPGGWHPEEKITPLQALKMFTTWAAYAAFADGRRGRLKRGYQADFTVLDQDITVLTDRRILNTKILMTVVAGETVFTRF